MVITFVSIRQVGGSPAMLYFGKHEAGSIGLRQRYPHVGHLIVIVEFALQVKNREIGKTDSVVQSIARNGINGG